MFHLMDEIFIKSLQSVQKLIINDKHCFELYGYDILLDSNLKPWLLEINASPSLTASSQDDFELKFRLLDDTLTIVDMENRLASSNHISNSNFKNNNSKNKQTILKINRKGETYWRI